MAGEALYGRLARFYDALYAHRNYSGEAAFVDWAVRTHNSSRGNALLDVGCGTGNHTALFTERYHVTGLDLHEAMLRVARRKAPKATFVRAEMSRFELAQRFDVIACLFGGINYNTDADALQRTLLSFAHHLKPGGTVVFDLLFHQASVPSSVVRMRAHDRSGLQLVALSHTHREGEVAVAEFVYFIKERGRLDFEVDRHRLGLFEVAEVVRAMRKVGLRPLVYAGYTQRRWSPALSAPPVFVGVNRHATCSEKSPTGRRSAVERAGRRECPRRPTATGIPPPARARECPALPCIGANRAPRATPAAGP